MGDSLSMVMGGAEASVSGRFISGGADGRRAASRSARTILLILDRESALRLRPGRSLDWLIPTGVEEPPGNGGGG